MNAARPVTRRAAGEAKPPIEKNIGHSSKNLGLSRKTLRPYWCPKLVTGLSSAHTDEIILNFCPKKKTF